MCVCCPLERVFKDGFIERVMFEQRPAGGEGLENLWRRGISSKGNSRCKGPEEVMHFHIKWYQRGRC